MEINLEKNKREVFMKSFLWNCIIDTFKNEKNIDITQYLVSITIKGDIFLVKTNKPIINSELLLLDPLIKKLFLSKTEKVGINLSSLNIKYI